MKIQKKLFRLLMYFVICVSFQFCDKENVNVPTDREISFEEKIKGTWKGYSYYVEYFNEEEELLFTDHEDVFIDNITLDGELLIYDYKNSSPNSTVTYTTLTQNDENYIIFPGTMPDVKVFLTENSMTWKETTDGGTFDDNYGNTQVQANYQIRTFKFVK